MKRIFLIILLLFATIAFTFTNFSEIPWGSSKENLTEILNSKITSTIIGKIPEVTILNTKDNILNIEVDEQFHFINDQLFMIKLDFRTSVSNEEKKSGYYIFRTILEDFKEKYGEPFKYNEGWNFQSNEETFKGSDPKTYSRLMDWGFYKPTALWIINNKKDLSDYECSNEDFCFSTKILEQLEGASIIKLQSLSSSDYNPLTINVTYIEPILYAGYLNKILNFKPNENQIEPKLSIRNFTINQGEKISVNLLDFSTNLKPSYNISFSLLDGAGSITGNIYTFSSTYTDVGTKTVTIQMKNEKEQLDKCTFTITVKKSKQPPEIEKSKGPSGLIEQAFTTFLWKGYDPDGSIFEYEYRKDNGRWMSNGKASSFVWGNYIEGEHTFEVRAIDNDGTYSNILCWNFEYSSEPKFQGFRDIEWGSSIEYVRSRVNEVGVEKTDEINLTSIVTVEEIRNRKAGVIYHFLDGKFFMTQILFQVTLGFSDSAYEIYLDVKDSLISKYGEPLFEKDPWSSDYMKETYEGEFSSYDILIMWGVYEPLDIWFIDSEKSLSYKEVAEVLSSYKNNGDLIDVAKKMGERTTLVLMIVQGNDSTSLGVGIEYYQGKLYAEYQKRLREKEVQDIESTF
jgi:hypothetical protein